MSSSAEYRDLGDSDSESSSTQERSRTPSPQAPLEPNVERAVEYLRRTLGDSLTQILSEVAQQNPKDPISYIADRLESLSPSSKHRTFIARAHDHASTRGEERRVNVGRGAPAKEANSHAHHDEEVSLTSPPSSTWSYNSYTSTDSGRSLSLDVVNRDEEDQSDQEKPRRRRKKRTPTVATTADEYKKRRGISLVPRRTAEDNLVKPHEEAGKKTTSTTQLTEEFDLDKHFEKSRKMREHRAAKNR